MKLTRRKFILGSTATIGGGLIIGIATRPGPGPVPGTRADTFQPNAFLQVTPDNKIIFQMARAEMGQGVYHGMTTIIAEELNVHPDSIQTELAGVYPDFNIGGTQITGGSMSTSGSWSTLREAGAYARAILVQAAANHWGIRPDQVKAADTTITNTISGETKKYGDFVTTAITLTGKDVNYKLKDPSEYRFIGKPAKRNDGFIKSTGKAQFGIDVNLPDTKIAVVMRPRQFGASQPDWKKSQISELPGFIQAFEIESGVAIIADSYWQAKKAADVLDISWQDGPYADLDSEKLLSAFKESLKNGASGKETVNEVESKGDLKAVLGKAGKVLKAEYQTPFLAHSTMEPQNATALFDGEKMEIWAPCQGVDFARQTAVNTTGLTAENITVNATFMGGGFGRRGYVDFVAEASSIAMQMPNTPIKVIWSREDDMQHDFYRPATYQSLKGTLDENGKILGWSNTVVSNSILEGIAPDIASIMLPDFIPASFAQSVGETIGRFAKSKDPTIAEGAAPPYTCPNLEVSNIINQHPIPVGFWRSVGHSNTAFASEVFMDEMANMASTDPVEFRREHLDDNHKRHRQVLDLATQKADWGNSGEGIYQGVALHSSFDSYVANVVEISVTGKDYKVKRVVSAVDCGLAVNPDIVIAQVQSAIIYGLTAATKDPITIKNGGVVQNNFYDAPVIRMNEAPKMEVYIVSSGESPTGIGEPGLPPVAPALSNAIFAATGQRLRKMPLKLV